MILVVSDEGREKDLALFLFRGDELRTIIDSASRRQR
jgi:hypothetical protein